jgi:antirestriction protein ArdC
LNVYEIVTARIMDQLQQGTIPWRKPWRTSTAEPRNLISGKAYRGINIFLLAAQGFASPFFLTFKQAMERGGAVKQGEKGCPVVFWKWLERGEDPAEGDEQEKMGRAPVLRYYNVFNVEQCEGLEVPALPVQPPFEPIPECERVVREMRGGPRIDHHGDQAFYRPSTDTVTLPRPEAFDSRELYYSILFHELTHASGHESRLARKGITDATMFGSHEYTKEELIAEMGAAFLSGHCGIEAATLGDSTSYIASWLKALKDDTRMVVLAAAQAQKAADLILGRAQDTQLEQAA